MTYCHKHGQGLATGRCTSCDDELISLGIQADKDKIAELQAFKDAALKLLDHFAYSRIEEEAKILTSNKN